MVGAAGGLELMTMSEEVPTAPRLSWAEMVMVSAVKSMT